jgi:hypothetical protein
MSVAKAKPAIAAKSRLLLFCNKYLLRLKMVKQETFYKTKSMMGIIHSIEQTTEPNLSSLLPKEG